jgi:hypothetical protein
LLFCIHGVVRCLPREPCRYGTRRHEVLTTKKQSENLRTRSKRIESPTPTPHFRRLWIGGKKII